MALTTNQLKTMALKSGANMRSANQAAKAYRSGTFSEADARKKYGGVSRPATPKSTAPVTKNVSKNTPMPTVRPAPTSKKTTPNYTGSSSSSRPKVMPKMKSMTTGTTSKPKSRDVSFGSLGTSGDKLFGGPLNVSYGSTGGRVTEGDETYDVKTYNIEDPSALLQGFSEQERKRLLGEYETRGSGLTDVQRYGDQGTYNWLRNVQEARKRAFDESQSVGQARAQQEASQRGDFEVTEDSVNDIIAQNPDSAEEIRSAYGSFRSGVIGAEELSKYLQQFGGGDVGAISGAPSAAPVGSTAPLGPQADITGGATAAGLPGGQPGGFGTDLTGVPQADNAIRGEQEILADTRDVSEDNFNVAEHLRGNQLRRELQKTNVADQIRPGMSVAELEGLSASVGLDLNDKEKQRLRAGGETQIRNMQLEKEMRMAEIDMTRGQMQRQFDRALTEREDFNTQQDTRLKRMLGVFGGGTVETLSGNMEVMHQAERGQRALDDLTAEFTAQSGMMSLRADTVIKQYTNNVNYIEGQMATAIEDNYSGLTASIDDLLVAGVTNKTDLNSAILGAKKEYIRNYNDITSSAATFLQKEQANMIAAQADLRKAQKEDDDFLTGLTGNIYYQGEEVINPSTGMPITSFDIERMSGTKDEYLTKHTGNIHLGGVDTGVPSSAALTEAAKASLAERKFKLEEDKFKAGGKGVTGAPGTNASGTMSSIPSYNAGNAKFNAVFSDTGGITFQVDEGFDGTGIIGWNGKDRSGDYQCGAFVNDCLGSGVMGDLYEDKMKKVTTQEPAPGAAFVMNAGKWGHTGIVENVNPDGSIDIVDSNRNENGIIRRTTLHKDPKTGKYKDGGIYIQGFTDGATPQVSKFDSIAQSIMQPYSTMKISDVKQEDRAEVERYLNQYRQQAIAEGGDMGYIRASAGSQMPSQKTIDTISAARGALANLETLESRINQFPTGPVAQVLSLNPYSGQSAEIEQMITALVPGLARGVFGEVGVLTDTDIARYKKTIPDFSNPNGVKQVIMEGLKDIVQRKIMETLVTSAQMGQDVSGAGPIAQEIMEKMNATAVSAVGDLSSLGADSVLITDNNTGENIVMTRQELENQGGPQGLSGWQNYSFTYGQ